ncbi:unnamed protein product [Phaedon cochleariae]|uniref:C2H2-type domain-containing protein n=1 Tax=Phaedon cochleariae TaxID=80249 RepID=A0A9N9SAI1_PHACE|nr:unnamed protein product [Phaedon cochleariae]
MECSATPEMECSATSEMECSATPNSSNYIEPIHQIETGNSVSDDPLSTYLKVEIETSPPTPLPGSFIETDHKVFKFRCPVCNKRFKDKEKAQHHVESHIILHSFFANEDSKCSQCNVYCKTSEDLKLHIAKHKTIIKGRPRKSSSSKSEDPEDDLKRFICESCAKSFKTKQQLQTHYLVHIDIKPFECDICQKSFKLKQQLHNHSKVHDDAKPFVCEVCKKGFKLKQHFENHSKTHSDERPFKCNFCEKAFKFKQHLQMHSRVHDDLRPFDCSFCGKAFKLKQQMQVHLKVHTDERPFQCDICNKSFKFKQQLHIHAKVHSKKVEDAVNGFFEQTLFTTEAEVTSDSDSNYISETNEMSSN